MPLEWVSWHDYIDLTPQKLHLFCLKSHQGTRRISRLALKVPLKTPLSFQKTNTHMKFCIV